MELQEEARPAFVDSRGVRWDTNDAELEGFMYKKSKWLGEIRERYFILKGSKIFFAPLPSDPPHGVIDLVDCISVKADDSDTNNPNTFCVSLKDENFSLSCVTSAERSKWITCIQSASMKHKAMFHDHVTVSD